MTGAAASLLAAARGGRTERRRLTLAIALGFGAIAASGGLLVTSGYLISRAAQRPDILTLTVAITAVRTFALARALLRYGERLASHDAALRLLARLRARFYSRLAPLVPGDVGGPHSGDLLSRFVGDVDTLQDLYLRALAPPVVAALVIGAATLAAWLLLPVAAPVVFVCLLVAATLVPALAALLASASGRRQAPARAELTAALVEVVDGASELAVAGCAGERIARLQAADERLAAVARGDAMAGGVATTLGSLCLGLTVVGVLLVGIPAVGDGALSGVLLAGLVFLVLGAFEGITPLALAARRLRVCAEAARRLDELCAREPSVRDPERPLVLPDDGALVLQDVRLRYGPGEPWVLDGVSLRVASGQRIALLGSSGAGKTTIAHLLVRFMDPDHGRVLLADVDVREMTQQDLRGAVVFAGQDAHLFNTTVRENVQLARPDATEGDLWQALEGAGVADWVHGLPLGLDTRVGEHGALVSGGQRQRIALARALLSDARFLVLDEPTAHVDADSARAIVRDIASRAGSAGVLMITHSEVGLEAFDEVLELRGGRIRRRPSSPTARQAGMEARPAAAVA